MACRKCGRALDEDARFCPSCGSATGGRCDNCGSTLDVDARFCKRCGTPVDGDLPGDDARERKVATLLFADLVDSTIMGEAHDPERVSKLVGQAFEALATEVRRYEGTIEKFVGDAMLAVFGVPAAHEDDPERAVRAALEMQAAMHGREPPGIGTPELALRIGIESGEILVDHSRATSERDLFVTGDAVNTAARLEAAAAPGTVVVGPVTHDTTRHVIDYAALPPLELKGKGTPVKAWKAVAVRTGRGGRRPPTGLHAPLVGRQNELARLKAVVAAAVEMGRPHLVTILGSAGVGKSRLVWELEKYLDGLPERYHWRKGRCLAYAGTSFGPIADIAKIDAHIADDEQPERARGKLRSRLAELSLGNELPRVQDALEALLGVGDGQQRSRDALFVAWQTYLESMARLHPLVLIVEDIHWADDATLSFLDLLARWGDGRIAIVCLARHELLERRPSWGTGLQDATTVIVEALDHVAGQQLVSYLFPADVSDPLRERVAALAEGSPLFAEEIVRMLMDRGIGPDGDAPFTPATAIDIPDTIHAVIAARLDALAGHEKRAAQVGAIIGRVFWDRPLARLLGEDLDSTTERLSQLRRKDLIIPREPSAFAGSSEFGFRHVLVRDVAYESITKADRARLHRAVASWVEDALDDRLDESAELVASHLASALAYEEELGLIRADGPNELREHAYAAAIRAADRASALGQSGNSCKWMRVAMATGRTLGRPIREIARLADRDAQSHWFFDDVADHVAELQAAVQSLEALTDLTPDDVSLLARLRAALGIAVYSGADPGPARSILRRGIEALAEAEPSAERARLYWLLGWTFWRAGPTDEAIAPLQHALDEAERCGDDVVERWAMHDMGVAMDAIGERAGGLSLMERSYNLARKADDKVLVQRCQANLTYAELRNGRPLPDVIDLARSGLEKARRAGQLSAISTVSGNLAKAYLAMGRPHDALACCDAAIEVMAAQESITRDYAGLGGQRRIARAIANLHRGDRLAAMADVAAVTAAVHVAEPQAAGEYFLAKAWLDWSDDPVAALSGLERGMETIAMHADQRMDVAREVIRMAVRLGERAALARGLDVHRQCQFANGRVPEAWSTWVTGLAEDDGSRTVERAAAVLETEGYILDAANAWADAALLAARVGRPSPALERAGGLLASSGLHLPLGDPPEHQWLSGSEATIEPRTPH